MQLRGFVRGSATWRVRIALAIKRLQVDILLHPDASDDPRQGGRPSASLPDFAPVLTIENGQTLTQSIAIIEWLDERWPTPALLPPDPAARARVRGFAMTIACDIQPMHGGRVLRRLRSLGLSEAQLSSWVRQSLDEGLSGCEALLNSADGPFCFGTSPTLADICLVPQMALARELGCDLTFPRLQAAEAACLTLPAFSATRPPAAPLETPHAT